MAARGLGKFHKRNRFFDSSQVSTVHDSQANRHLMFFYYFALCRGGKRHRRLAC